MKEEGLAGTVYKLATHAQSISMMKNNLLIRLCKRCPGSSDKKSSTSLMKRERQLSLVVLMGLFVMFSCKDDTPDPVPTPPTPEPPLAGPTITVKPATLHQEMIGFGGALTWYSDRVLTNSKVHKGLQVLRLRPYHHRHIRPVFDPVMDLNKGFFVACQRG